jgi:hypothetical protein
MSVARRSGDPHLSPGDDAPGAIESGEMPNPPMPTGDGELTRIFPRAHKQALGAAVGLTMATIIFLVTAFHVILRPQGLPLELLNQYFYRYEVSWTGALIGAAWGFGTGFVGGWLLAFVHNFTVGAWLLLVRARHDLQHMRDFLDHI